MHFVSKAGTVQLAAQEYLGTSGHLLGLNAKELKKLVARFTQSEG